MYKERNGPMFLCYRNTGLLPYTYRDSYGVVASCESELYTYISIELHQSAEQSRLLFLLYIA